MKASLFHDTKRLLTIFTARNTRRSSVWFGLFAGGVAALQATAYVATYPDDAARQQLAAAFAGNPMLSILYGDPTLASTPEGYIVFRCLNVLLFAAALWALLSATKLFRGQEEEGRWELLLSGQITAAQAVWCTFRGWLLSASIAWLLCAGAVAAVGHSHDIQVSLTAGAFFALVVMMMAALFAAIGALTSQLAATKRRATIYGLIPLGVFFVLRALAHITSDLAWLKNFTPFGWLEKANPIMGSRPLWLLPVLALTLVCMAAAVFIASRRDLGDSVIAGRDVVQPRFGLLGSPLAFGLRSTLPMLISWLLTTLAFVGITAGVTSTAIDSVQSSSSITNTLADLSGGTASLAVAFISMTTFLSAIVLFFMAANGVGALRAEEFKSYLDNLLVRPVGRRQWLVGRTVVLFGAMIVINILASATVWAIAWAQGIHLDGLRLIFEGLNTLGPLALALGAGLLLYGWRPRIAPVALYGLLLWSFLVDTIGSSGKLNQVIVDTSLFHHMALVPAVHPQWLTFGITLAIGVLMAGIGIVLFSHRDLETE